MFLQSDPHGGTKVRIYAVYQRLLLQFRHESKPELNGTEEEEEEDEERCGGERRGSRKEKRREDDRVGGDEREGRESSC